MDTKRLLRKKGWTGAEIGKAIIVNLCNSYSGKPRPFPLDTIKGMFAGIRGNKKQTEAYNRYVSLQSWITQYHAVANVYYQSFVGAYREFKGIHGIIDAAESETRYIEKLPRIMTQSQYEAFRARRIEEQLDGGLIIETDLFSLITFLAEHSLPLHKLKKKYQGEKLTSADAVEAFNRETGNGYYSLPDGTRSDKTTAEKWAARFLAYSPGVTEEDALLLYNARARHIGEPEQEERGAAEWNVNKRDPVTKWQVLEAVRDCELTFMQLYPCLAGMSYDFEDATEKDYKAQAKAFITDFPELVEMAFAEMQKTGLTYKGKPLEAVPAERWHKVVFDPRELYEKDFPGLRSLVEVSIFGGDNRATENGVAILQPAKGFNSAAIDANGNYIEPDGKSCLYTRYGIAAYYPETENSGDNIARIENLREDLEYSLRFICAYDTALELIADEIGIPEFMIFAVGAADCVKLITTLNSMFDLLYTAIEDANHESAEEQQKKLQVLRDVFYPLKAEGIPPETRAKAAQMLEGLEPFKEVVYNADFLDIMVKGGAAE